MRAFSALTMAFVAAGFAASCEDDDYESACEHYSAVACEKFVECYAGFGAHLGDPATCTDRFTRSCEAGMALDGVLATPSDLDSCATVFEEASCDEMLNALMVQCLPLLKGERPDGSPCATGMQCQGGECDSSGEGTCGVCVTHPGEGEACEGRCQLGLVCEEMTCQQMTFSGLGEPCGSGVGCAPQYACDGTVCAERKGEGEPCSGSECQLDLQCDPSLHTCQPRPPPAAVGEACEGVPCVYDAYCEQGVCQPRIPDGESCTDSQQCFFAARCDGVCTLEPPVCN